MSCLPVRVCCSHYLLPRLRGSVPKRWRPTRTRRALSVRRERLRSHFDVVAEGMRDLVRIVAEGVSTVLNRNRRDSQE